jgi:peroxiredoxin
MGVGVSTDSANPQGNFAAELGLPFALVVNPK